MIKLEQVKLDRTAWNCKISVIVQSVAQIYQNILLIHQHRIILHFHTEEANKCELKCQTNYFFNCQISRNYRLPKIRGARCSQAVKTIDFKI